MAFIKTDPSQTKSVVALLVMLVLAIGAVIYRLSPSAPPAPVKKATAAASSANVSFEQAQAQDATRNPFAKPTFVKAVNVTSRGTGRFAIDKAALRKMMISGLNAPQSSVEVKPMPVPDVVQVTPHSDAQKPEQKTIEKKPEPKPSFHLLATVKGDNGFNAVMRVNDTDTRVVEVGDKLDGGFKIVKLQSDCAVLTDGKDTIVATRQAALREQVLEGREQDAH